MASRNRSRETDDSPQGSPDLPGPARHEAGAVPGDALVRIHDLAGRPRGTGFLADHHGTLITSHEAVDGLPRLVLYGAGGRRRVVSADAVTPCPHWTWPSFGPRGSVYRRCPSPCGREPGPAPMCGSPPTAGARHGCWARPP